MGWRAVVGVQRVEKRAQHTAMGGVSAESDGGGDVRARFYSLRVCKKLFNPTIINTAMIRFKTRSSQQYKHNIILLLT